MAVHHISDEIRSHFHLFCDNFPVPVMLVHKDRTIIAVNKAGESAGYPTGIRCVDMGQKEHHKGCMANQALAEQTAKRVVGWFDYSQAVLDSYWIPLSGTEDLYLHFAADITQWAAESLIPKKCDTADNCTSCNCG